MKIKMAICCWLLAFCGGLLLAKKQEPIVNSILSNTTNVFARNFVCLETDISLLLHLVSLVRPAPAEFPQDRKVARVGGRSGAIPWLTFFLTSRRFDF